MRRVGMAVAALVALSLSACSVSVVAGRFASLDGLDRLKPGESTRAEALQEIGHPYGCGRAQFPDEREPRDVCYYYYGEATLKDSHGMYLLVFFREGRYDGYMWFSSLRRDAAQEPVEPAAAPRP
jgi:hypothetical protein